LYKILNITDATKVSDRIKKEEMSGQKVEAERLAILPHIREVPETGYPDCGSSGFPQPLQANSRIVPQLRPRPLPSISVQIHHSLIIALFDVI
jgi:hypothetical protein